MERFRADGHLSDDALQTLLSGGELDELDRLEIAEHLAFCDACLQRYTDLLADRPLLAPEHSCRERLWVRVRTRTIRLVTSRYATAAAAVALALTMLWGSGPTAKFLSRPLLPQDRPTVSEDLHAWSARWSDSLDQAMSGFNDFFDGFASRRPQSTQGGTFS